MNLSDASGYQGKMLAVGAHRFNVLAATIGLSLYDMARPNQSDTLHATTRGGEKSGRRNDRFRTRSLLRPHWRCGIIGCWTLRQKEGENTCQARVITRFRGL